MSGSGRSPAESEDVPSGTPTAFWLLPCAEDARWLQDLIRDLAQRHGGPVFEPHVTLHVGVCPPGVDAEGPMGRIAESWPALDLTAGHTRESEVFYKSLFVEIATDRSAGPRLRNLRSDLVTALQAASVGRRGAAAGDGASATMPADYAFHPHLSLLYGNLAQPLRSSLAQQYDLGGRNLVFDRIAAVRPVAGRRDLSEVAHWEVFGHRALSAQPVNPPAP